MHVQTSLLLAAVVAAGAGVAGKGGPAAMFAPLPRQPDVSARQIVFAAADSLWLVPRTGGIATPLTRTPGQKSRPRFSPDGHTVAFDGNYDGSDDLYTLPVDGGTIQRVTHRGYAHFIDWTPEGWLLYTSNAFSFSPSIDQLFTVPASGGLPNRLPVPYGVDGAISPDGQWLAYTQHAVPTYQKRDRGGEAPAIWLFNLNTHASRRVTAREGVDAAPMWHGDHLYYLSDAGLEQRLNLWTYDLQNGRHRQITHYSDYDVRWPAMGPGAEGQGEIVFVHAADLCLLDLGTETAHVVAFQISGEQTVRRPRSVDASKFMSTCRLSPTGERVVLEARGDIWTVPSQNGSPRNLTRTSGVAERDPAWSPDGKWIAYFSDASGEYELYLAPANDQGPARPLTTSGPGFRSRPTWSPDSQQIVFVDNAGGIYLHTLAAHETKRIDLDPLGHTPDLSWSPDSSWLAYTRGSDNRYAALWLRNVATGQSHQVTSGRFQDSGPVFDRKGDFLFFVSARDFSSPAFDSLYGASFIYPSTDVLLAVPLRQDVTLPWAPRSDEEKAQLAETDGNHLVVQATRDRGTPLVIDLDGFERRVVQLPTARGRLWNLAVTHEGTLLFAHTSPEGEASIRMLDPADPNHEAATVVTGTGDFNLSADGKKLLVRKGDSLAIVSPAPGQSLDHPVSLAGMTVEIDPAAEWRQIFADAWRFLRDFFYDAQMHHADWAAMREKYAKLLDHCASRDDVNDTVGQMIGELSASHCGVRNPGDVARPPEGAVGMLGVDFERHAGAYRIAKIYEGAPWDVDARSPLREPGVNVQIGEYLLAVNGVPLDPHKDPWAEFQGLAGRVATLTINSQPTIDARARDVVVKLLPSDGPESERTLRYRAWIERNRAYVEQRSEGKVGYIYVPNTGNQGVIDLVRQFHGQMVKEALIIDDRWNGGGRGPDRMLELLHRPLNFYVTGRHGLDWHDPGYSHQGPQCMLINGWSVSGGENFPFQFRRAGLGKLIGTRTAGSLLAGSSPPPFIDGGSRSVPAAAFYEAGGSWVVEGGPGVLPDIEVLEDPARMANGEDPQLDAAIDLMLAELKQHPLGHPRRPSSPDR
jgi:tricorn protease